LERHRAASLRSKERVVTYLQRESPAEACPEALIGNDHTLLTAPHGQQPTPTAPHGQQPTPTTAPHGQQPTPTAPHGQHSTPTAPHGQKPTDTAPHGQQLTPKQGVVQDYVTPPLPSDQRLAQSCHHPSANMMMQAVIPLAASDANRSASLDDALCGRGGVDVGDIGDSIIADSIIAELSTAAQEGLNAPLINECSETRSGIAIADTKCYLTDDTLVDTSKTVRQAAAWERLHPMDSSFRLVLSFPALRETCGWCCASELRCVPIMLSLFPACLGHNRLGTCLRLLTSASSHRLLDSL